tara:strand:+ start:672 stop:947 length:276 start_codon:yes stop_codon:yes gene_type:complete
LFNGANEAIFYDLIIQEQKGKEIRLSKKDNEEWIAPNDFTSVYPKVFGVTSKKNINELFSSEIMKILWTKSFIKSKNYRDFYEKFNQEELN